MQNITFHGWEPEPDICGEAAMMTCGQADYQMAVTPLRDGGVEADLLDGATLIWRQWMPTMEAAKQAVERRARQQFVRAV